ncbi:hypothetical protein IOQ59_14180 [Pontibacterium sp. N1Y112]|uniref:Glycosyltransferase n=1 Tax=Pontibacterium sinense TaxID=2781979 RepID=A0A8J7K6F8_9GAMM|nr:hypothetical protein [Pontibacterium sinense]MBE9398405.1 hypothetical protein [Pontibacterium sinense]
MKIDILSDIPYQYYQHVNQSLYREFNKNHDVRFFQKFFLHSPSVGRFFKLKRDRGFSSKINNELGVVDVFGFPSTIPAINSFVLRYLKKKHDFDGDIAVAFVANEVTRGLLSGYDKKVYYCVHDYEKQGLSSEKIREEKRLVKDVDVVLCDNEIVLKRISEGEDIVSVFDANKNDKYIMVPPLVSLSFYNIPEASVKYDYIYYGSIHEDLDLKLIISLARNGKRIFIVSNECSSELYSEGNIFISPATTDFSVLCNYIAQANEIILPYKNSEFMNTVTPAKVFQSLATGKRVCTSNLGLSKKYGICTINELGGYGAVFDAVIDVDKYKESNVLSNIKRVLGL